MMGDKKPIQARHRSGGSANEEGLTMYIPLPGFRTGSSADHPSAGVDFSEGVP